MLNVLPRRPLRLPRHIDPEPGSTIPQAERYDTPVGVGVVGGINDGLGRHDPGQWRPLCMQYLMLIVVDLMKK